MSEDLVHDVFLSHNSRDKVAVRDLKARLATIGLLAWLDEDELQPGLRWQKPLDAAIKRCKSVAVLIGPSGVGPWEEEEVETALIYAVRDGRPVIPVFLPGAPADSVLPPFLSNRGRVDLRPSLTAQSLDKLRWGITGQRAAKQNQQSSTVSPKDADTFSCPKASVPTIRSDLTALKDYSAAEHAMGLLLKHQWQPGHNAYRDQESVTKFIKELVNSSPEMQRETLNAIQQIYPTASALERVKVVYILGRLRDPFVRKDAANMLNALFREHTDAFSPFSNASEALLQRTFYISRTYLGDENAANEYVEQLLANPRLDNLNRGFHLAYYGDTTAHGDSPFLVFDEPNCVADKTFAVLVARLVDDTTKERLRPMTGLELQTSFALAVPRHLYGKLSDTVRVQLLEILNDLRLSRCMHFQPLLVSFLDAAASILQQPQASVGSVASELHNLKQLHRSGWNNRHKRRVVSDSESVADHSWGSMFLADIFLPEHGDGDELKNPEYSKVKVIRMLLIHDLVEPFMSDKPVSEMTELDRIDENVVMGRLSALGAFPEFAGAAAWRGLANEYIERTSINSRLARDFELIDYYFQLQRYSENPANSIPDAEILAVHVLENLRTTFCKHLARQLRHPNSPVLHWFERRV